MLVHLQTLGCRLNEAELETWAQGFKQQGHAVTQDVEQADLLVVNTCAVTQEAVKKSRQLIRKQHRNNPKAKLVVSGCYASLDDELQNDIEEIDLVIPNKDKDKLVEQTLENLSFESMSSVATQPGESSLFQRGRQRAFIKVQDGCRYRCTFCIVTIARGEERSRSKQEIINEINTLVNNGIKEIVITGVHVGGYGSDIDSNLYELLNTILKETDVPRIRLASVEPWDLPDNFFGLFQNPRLMPHMHLPIQSGSDTVLRRMARRCKTEEFRELIHNARQAVPNFNATTDIIVGFPGETEEEWQETLAFVEEIQFPHIHIFTYSPRQGTKAANLPAHIDKATQKQRSKALHELTAKMNTDFLAQQFNQEVEVLWENQLENGNWTGYTPNYLRVELLDSSQMELENIISSISTSDLNKEGFLLQGNFKEN